MAPLRGSDDALGKGSVTLDYIAASVFLPVTSSHLYSNICAKDILFLEEKLDCYACHSFSFIS